MATASRRVHAPPTRKGRSQPPGFLDPQRGARFDAALAPDMQRGSAISSAPMSLIHGGISGSAPQPGRGLHRPAQRWTMALLSALFGLRLLDGEARKSRPRGVRFRQGRRHTNHRQSSAIVQALPVLTTGPRMGSTSPRACAACHSSQCKQAGVADSENPPFAVVTCTSSPGPSRPCRASRGAPISPSRSVNRICLSGLRWRQRRG
jgi:hypothetical protein